MTKRADYEIVDCGEVNVAEVSVSWHRLYGKNDRRRHTKHTTIYTQKALKAWGKRNGVNIPDEDIKKLPRSIN